MPFPNTSMNVCMYGRYNAKRLRSSKIFITGVRCIDASFICSHVRCLIQWMDILYSENHKRICVEIERIQKNREGKHLQSITKKNNINKEKRYNMKKKKQRKTKRNDN